VAWFADELGEWVQLLQITSGTGMFDGEVELDTRGASDVESDRCRGSVADLPTPPLNLLSSSTRPRH